MESDELARFRAAHPSVADAIAHCERPDWALRLAFDASADRKAVIRCGSNTANSLLGDRVAIAMVTPWPQPLEAVDVWSGNADVLSRAFTKVRAIALGALVAGPLTILIDRYAIGPQLASYGLRVLVFNLVFAIVLAVFATLIRRAIASVIRGQVARLDDASALATVLSLVAKGAAKHPANMPTAVKLLRLNLVELVTGSRT